MASSVAVISRHKQYFLTKNQIFRRDKRYQQDVAFWQILRFLTTHQQKKIKNQPPKKRLYFKKIIVFTISESSYMCQVHQKLAWNKKKLVRKRVWTFNDYHWFSSPVFFQRVIIFLKHFWFHLFLFILFPIHCDISASTWRFHCFFSEDLDDFQNFSPFPLY